MNKVCSLRSGKSLLLFVCLLLASLFHTNTLQAQCAVSAGSNVSVCQGDRDTLRAIYTLVNPTITWYVQGNPAVIFTGPQFPIPTNTPGNVNYVVKLDSGSCVRFDTVRVTTNPKPNASFTFSPNSGCGRTRINFTNTSTVSSGSISSYNWDFDDGGTSNQQNPSHIFRPTPGGGGSQTFQVRLIVTSNNGCKDTVTQNVTIGRGPDAALDGTPALTQYNGQPYFYECVSSGTTSSLFTFINQSSTASTNTSYLIKWGDGNQVTQPSTWGFGSTLTHTYNIGIYQLTFIAYNGACVDSTIYNVFVGSNPGGSISSPSSTYGCTGQTFSFPFANVSGNSPGTQYIISVNDGSDTVRYTQETLPAVFTHVFDSTSCGVGTNNTFTVSYIISNPCGETPGTIGGIRISKVSDAEFSIQPQDTICVNSNITFTNTGTAGSIVPNSGSGPCTPGKLVWEISPAGWALSSGTLGSDNGNGQPNTWTSGSNSIGVTFTNTGTFSVNLQVGSNQCGSDDTTRLVCVNPTPTASFTVNNTTGCAPLAVAATNTSPGPVCGQNSYFWSVSYAPTAGCLPNTSDFIFTNGTNANSVNPQFQFNNPGVYTISLITIAPANACSSVVATQQVIVKGKPVVTIGNVPGSICVGQQVSPSSTATCYITGASTYLWTFSGGTPASSTEQNPSTPISFPTLGAHVITLAVTNECGTTTENTNVTVNTVTSANAGPVITRCGNTVTMAGNTPTIGTGLWTQTNGPVTATITNPSSPTTTITGLVPGSYIFTWTITNGSCTSFSNMTVNISAGPTPANAGPDQDFCQATSATLAGNNPSVGTGAWTQTSGPAGATITNPASPNTTVTGLVVGVYEFTWTTTFSNCTPSTDIVRIRVLDGPSTAAAGPDQTICSSTATMAANNPTIGTGTWTYVSGPAGSVISNPSSPTTNISGLVAGTYVFAWTISNAPCPASTDNVSITVTAVGTTANAGSDIRACDVSSISLAGNTAVVGTGTWAYVSGPAGSVITTPSSATSTVTGLVPGTYVFSWTITNGTCPPSSDQVQVIIDAPATVANAGPDQQTCGAGITLAGNTATIGAGTWAQVSGPAGAVISNPSSPTSTVTNATPGTYVFSWTITNGSCTSTDNVTVVVAPGPSAANAGSDIRSCDVSSVNLSGNNPAVGTGAWTQVSGPAGAVITNPSAFNTSVTGLTAGTYVFRWTISNSSCPPSIDEVEVIIDAAVTIADAGPDQSICGTSAVMAANTAAVGTGVWAQASGPNTASIVNAASPTTSVTGLIPGTYVFSWTITNGSCSSSNTVTINIFGGASTSTAGPDQDLCLATSVNLSAGALTVGTGVWTQVSGPAGAVITNPSNTSTTVTGMTVGVYQFEWTVSFSNCTPNRDTVRIRIFDNPTPSAAGPDQVICAASATLAANTPSIGTGAWAQVSGPNTAVITNTSLPNTTVTGLVPGVYIFNWVISNGPCPASTDQVQITVNEVATVANAGPDTVFCNQPSISLMGNTALVGTGVWTLTSGQAGVTISNPSQPNSGVTGLTPGNAYTFQWTITSGVCPPSTDQVTINILNPLTNNITAPVDTICSGQTVQVNGDIPTGGNGTYAYQWQQSPDGVTWTDIPGATGQNYASPALTTNTYYRRKAISLPCEQFSNVILIVVQPGIDNNIIASNAGICINTTSPTITGSTPTGGDGNFSYQWQVSTDGGLSWTDISGATGINYSPGVLTDTTLYRRLVNTTLCSGPQANVSNVVTITVYPNAIAEYNASDTVSCAPFDVSTVISTVPYPAWNQDYNWYADGVLFGSNTTGVFPGYTITNPGDTVDIKLVVTSPFGCLPDSILRTFITVRTAVAGFVKDTSGGCGPLTANFTNTTNIIDPSIEFYWYNGSTLFSTAINPPPVTFLSSPFFVDTTYIITLQAYNGCDTTVWRDSVRIKANPKAAFSVSSTSGCSPFTIQVTNSSLGNNTAYYWDFGNGDRDTTYANGTFSYTYFTSVVDTFRLQLIAENDCGRDTQVVDIRVAPNIIRPGITISATELFGCVSHTVTFSNTTTGATSFTWDFGDGTPPVTTNQFQFTVPHVYTTPGDFTITINMTNGCSDTSITKQVSVYARPLASFSPDRLVYCSGDTVRVSNTSQNANSYSWEWGDTRVSSGFEPTHVYAAPGTYTIRLTAQRTNASGVVCFDTTTRSVTVLSKPDTLISTNISSVNCTPFNISANVPNSTNETITWYVYDTTLPSYPVILTGANMSYSFNNEGTFTVVMLIENAAGCRDSSRRVFTVYKKPVAGFSPLNVVTCNLDTTITHINTSTANAYTPLRYEWWVDGVRLSTGGNFTHQYLTPANAIFPRIYNTMLIATNTVGCRDTISGTVQVEPTAKSIFTVSNPGDCIPFVASISNNSTYASNYAWYLNGSLVSNDPVPSINITQANTNYTITLIVSNTAACRPDTSSFSFRSRVMPVASFTINDSLGCTGQLNVITNNTSQFANAYTWDWGDGSPQSNLPNPTHLYNSVGTFRITLTASDGVCRDTASRLVVVAREPVVDFVADNERTCDTAVVRFSNLTTNADTYQWIFSHGQTSTEAEPTIIFPPSNTPYTVQLIATNAAGCRASLTKANYIRSIVPPVADFVINPSPTISIPNYNFSFSNLTANSPLYTYEWSLGDGTFANTRDIPNHQYADTGSYPVRLIVLDTSTNCLDTIIRIARIQGAPGYLYVPNAFYPNSIQTQFRSFKPLGKGLAEYELMIFDAWGKLLFKTNRLDAAGAPVEGWDGTFNGKPMPQDAYAWKIKAVFRNGRKWEGMNYNNNVNGAPGQTFGTVTLFR